jgi:hypothetical protein
MCLRTCLKHCWNASSALRRQYASWSALVLLTTVVRFLDSWKIDLNFVCLSTPYCMYTRARSISGARRRLPTEVCLNHGHACMRAGIPVPGGRIRLPRAGRRRRRVPRWVGVRDVRARRSYRAGGTHTAAAGHDDSLDGPHRIYESAAAGVWPRRGERGHGTERSRSAYPCRPLAEPHASTCCQDR